MTIDTPSWVRDAIFYQIFPDRFASSERVQKPGPLEPWDTPPTVLGFKGGDLLGIVEHLPYLVDLGVNAIYLNPIFASAANHRYHTYDYFTVDPLLGGNDALRELLDVAHARGMRVILDGVFNHTGRGFWPFHHVLENGAASPYRRWFHFDQAALDAGRPIDAYPGAAGRNGLDASEPHVGRESPTGDGTWSQARLGYRAWWDLAALPKLNTDEPMVREYLLSVAEHWIRFGADGWRLDVPAEIHDESFWQEFRRRCRAANPEAYLVGEIWYVAPDWLRGDRFDALMNYPLAQAILGYAAGDALDEEVIRSHNEFGAHTSHLDGPGFAARVMDLNNAYDPAVVASQLNLLDSHDAPRFLTMAGGDRDAYRMAVLLQATLPGAPCVYYGDEIGMEGRNDPDCRRSFPWDETRQDVDLLAFVRAAFAARNAEPALRRGSLRVAAADRSAVAFERADDGGRLIVAVNAGPEPVCLTLDERLAPGTTPTQVELPGWSARVADAGPDGRLVLELPARSGYLARLP